MKRRLLTIFVFFLIGAVVNIAVAWGCALWVSPGLDVDGDWARRNYGPEHDPIRKWEVNTFNRPGATLVVSIRSRIGGEMPDTDETPSLLMPEWADLSAEPHFSVRSTMEYLVFDARGWPLISLWCEREFLDLHEPTHRVEGGIKTGFPQFQNGPLMIWFRPALPLRPIWRNFAANTVFYAVILWLAIRGPLVLRRTIRRRRGRCPNCGYPVGTSTVCTECGSALAVTRSAKGHRSVTP